MRIVAAMLATVAASLALAATAGAATISVQIKSTGFSPGTHLDQPRRHGHVEERRQDRPPGGRRRRLVRVADPARGPVVHGDAQPRAGSFRYHDSFHASHAGRVTVKGPPPSLTLALSAPIVDYGTAVDAHRRDLDRAGEPVGRDRRAAVRPGVADPARRVKTGHERHASRTRSRRRSTRRTSRAGTTPRAERSLVQVAPKLRLLAGGNGYMKAVLTAPSSMAGKHVYLQRLSPFGQWVNLANLTLGARNGRLFKPVAYLPKGVSHIRVFLSVNQAGIGLLSAHSGTQTVVRRSNAHPMRGRALEGRPPRRGVRMKRFCCFRWRCSRRSSSRRRPERTRRPSRSRERASRRRRRASGRRHRDLAQRRHGRPSGRRERRLVRVAGAEERPDVLVHVHEDRQGHVPRLVRDVAQGHGHRERLAGDR